jgi:hypothetical protein
MPSSLENSGTTWDDCIIMTGEGEEDIHTATCHYLFEIFTQHSLFLKLAKCEFFRKEIDYLGIHVKGRELIIDPTKIAGIKEWPTTLKNVKEVRSTLGLIGYHHPWIPNFTQIAKPLMDLLKKGKEFAWEKAQTQAVN